MVQFKKLLVILRQVTPLSLVIALTVLCACAGHNESLNGGPATPPPPSPQPTPRPAPVNPFVRQKGCRVDLTAHVPSRWQMKGSVAMFHVSLVLAARGDYQLYVEGQSCSSQSRQSSCEYFQSYSQSYWRSLGIETDLYEGRGQLLGLITPYPTDSTTQARLELLDNGLKNVGLPDVIFLNVSECAPTAPASSGKH